MNGSKISTNKTEEALIIHLLAKIFSLKFIQEVIFSINTYEQDMIAVDNENKRLKIKTDWIIVIICLCYQCWGIIIVYHYYIWLNVLFRLMKQNILLMNLRLNIWSIQFCTLIKPSETKYKNICILYLVNSHNSLLKSHF